MGDVVDLKPTPLIEDQGFIADCCRYRENILSEAAVRKKYRFSDAEWERLGGDDKLLEAIEAEQVRRVRTGLQKRERAQVLVTQAPDVVSGILMDPGANARHRLDAAQVLDKFAATTPESTPAGDRFQIVINLGADSDGRPIVERFDKSLTIDVNDGAPAAPGAMTTVKPRDDQW